MISSLDLSPAHQCFLIVSLAHLQVPRYTRFALPRLALKRGNDTRACVASYVSHHYYFKVLLSTCAF